MPPTIDEVLDYCIESGIKIDAEHFVDYYTANGWRVGKNKMRDWKAAARNWERNRESTMLKDNSRPGDEFIAFMQEQSMLSHQYEERQEII